MDLSLLKALEREKVLEVLQRDKVLRSVEEERIRRLKLELQEIRRKGAKSFSRQYSERTCARCQRPLGKLWNCGAVCVSCSHRICKKCRISITAREWKCTVCHAYREVKIKSGEWFLEERAKKFPAESERNETIGEKLLKSNESLSQICIFPPTPPPFYEGPSSARSGGPQHSKDFTKSVENLFVSFTTHIKKLSKSQNDVTVDRALLTANYYTSSQKDRRSQSDTAINKPSNVAKPPSLPSLFKKSKKDDLEGVIHDYEEKSSSKSYSGEKRGSVSSVGTEYGNSAGTAVTGQVEFAVNYNFMTSCLEITMKACKDLVCGQTKRNKCHPYVKIYLLPDKSPNSKLKTNIKKNTENPVFDETLVYQIDRPQLASRTLQVSVWHSGALRRKVFLGEVLLPLKEWKFEDPSTQHPSWYQLQHKAFHEKEPSVHPEILGGCPVEQYNGKLLIKAKFVSTPEQIQRDDIHIRLKDIGQLMVVVTEDKNLPISRCYGTQNLFVKGCLSLPGDRELMQRTPVQKTKPNSQWSQQLVFSNVTTARLLEACLELEVWELASLGHGDHLLGRARLEGGQSWQQVLQMTGAWQNFTLPTQVGAISKKE